MAENRLEKSATKICESCGSDFDCGASGEKCWCFEIDLSPQTLAKLQKGFQNCLCKDCLIKEKEPRA